MAVILQVTGVGEVMKRLAASKAILGTAITRGLVEAGQFLQAKSQDIVPVQMSDLKNSAFTRNIGGQGMDADVVVGYTAGYAIYVHEIMPPYRTHGKEFNVKHAAEIAAAVGTKKGTAKGGMFNRGENQQAKFLETPMRMYRKEILQHIIEGAART
jgi:hypothetical protein